MSYLEKGKAFSKHRQSRLVLQHSFFTLLLTQLQILVHVFRSMYTKKVSVYFRHPYFKRSWNPLWIFYEH